MVYVSSCCQINLSAPLATRVDVVVEYPSTEKASKSFPQTQRALPPECFFYCMRLDNNENGGCDEWHDACLQWLVGQNVLGAAINACTAAKQMSSPRLLHHHLIANTNNVSECVYRPTCSPELQGLARNTKIRK
jgi:hypothetical protein